MKKGGRISWGRRRRLMLLAVGAVAAGLSITAYAAHLLRGPELQVTDAHFSIRGKTKPPTDVAVVAIDAATFQAIDKTWPFPRAYEAKVIDRLRAAGARVIAVDLQFTAPTDQTDDEALAQSIYSAGNVVLTTDQVDAKGHSSILGGDQVLRQLHATWGISSVKPDGDGVYRRVYYSVSGVRTFAAAAASRALGRRIQASAFPGPSAPIDFAGPPDTIKPISFSDVYYGRVPASRFKGRVVVVGAADPTLQDVHPTAASRSEQMSGPELQASAMSTILRGFPLKDASGWLNIVLIAVLGFAVPLANLRLRSWRAVGLALLIAGAYVVATQLAFNSGLIISFAYPLLAMTLATVGTLGADYLFTAFQHQRVRDTFSRFVHDAVIEEVLAHAGDDLRLGGEQLESTVMFTDLRGFTSFSETLPAPKVIEVVNYYLNQMTEAIMDAGGTLVSYMGDGIMAVFGAPLTQPDHADRALRAAREMLTVRLPRFNAWIREQQLGDHDFRMGIGLNSGTVMAGNVGSERRVEFSAIGDTTNTASRLEGMTKGTEYMLFLSEATREHFATEPDDLLSVGEFEIRGRVAKARIWSIPEATAGLAVPDAPPPAVASDTPPSSPAASPVTI